jgi:hypothetical protein
MSETQRDCLLNAIGVWMTRVESYPGWRAWKRTQFAYTLDFDEMATSSHDEQKDEFIFPDEMAKEHAVVAGYLGLHDTVHSLKECEFYFRRYPFRGLPVTRHSHIRNVCEMYFGRFYEFKERLKNYFDAVDASVPDHHLEVGKFIKSFDRTFNQELRSRNYIHHHNRFEDLAIDRVFLTEAISLNRKDKGWKTEHLIAYRKFANEWAQRVRQRGEKVDEFLEAVAIATLKTCRFLSVEAAAGR